MICSECHKVISDNQIVFLYGKYNGHQTYDMGNPYICGPVVDERDLSKLIMLSEMIIDLLEYRYKIGPFKFQLSELDNRLDNIRGVISDIGSINNDIPQVAEEE